MLRPNHDSLELFDEFFVLKHKFNKVGSKFLPTEPAANTALALFGSNAMALPSCSKAAACDPF